jgi:hypothetical protein
VRAQSRRVAGTSPRAGSWSSVSTSRGFARAAAVPARSTSWAGTASRGTVTVRRSAPGCAHLVALELVTVVGGRRSRRRVPESSGRRSSRPICRRRPGTRGRGSSTGCPVPGRCEGSGLRPRLGDSRLLPGKEREDPDPAGILRGIGRNESCERAARGRARGLPPRPQCAHPGLGFAFPLLPRGHQQGLDLARVGAS